MMRITISIDPDEYRAVERLAERDERSSAWVIRKAVKEFVERNAAHASEGNNGEY